MTTELLCFDCLTDDSTKVPAVTTVNGTAVCETCARERAETMASLDFSPPPFVAGPPPG